MAVDDSALARFGYASGNYTFKCLGCGATCNWGDKRATSCRGCAVAAYHRVASKPENPRDCPDCGLSARGGPHVCRAASVPDDVVERVARAICEENGWSADDVVDIHPKWLRYIPDAQAALSAIGITGWQPIETAPRDGSVFYAWLTGGYGLAIPISYHHPFWYASRFDAAPVRLPQGVEPTHWMPRSFPPYA